MCFSQDKEYEKCSELLQKKKKKRATETETGVLKMQTDSLPAGGALRAVDLAVSSNGCKQSSYADERNFIR